VEGLVKHSSIKENRRSRGKEGEESGDIFVFVEDGDDEWDVVGVSDGEEDANNEPGNNTYSVQHTHATTTSAAEKFKINKGKRRAISSSPPQQSPPPALPPSTEEQKKVKTYAQQYDERGEISFRKRREFLLLRYPRYVGGFCFLCFLSGQWTMGRESSLRMVSPMAM